MLDKISIKAKISGEECVHMQSLHHLRAVTWHDEKGTLRTDYISGPIRNATGMEVRITNNVFTLSTSLHKLWQRRMMGKSRNDNVFTISEAKAAFELLLFENGLLPGRVTITYFEIGLNMNVSYDPLTFIELAQYVPRKNDVKTNKVMFVDANYKINRQKTSEKHKDIRRHFKIYDKAWEMEEKKRTPKQSTVNSQQSTVNPSASLVPLKGENKKGEVKKHVLRIETVYRRQNERGDKFFMDENMNRLAKVFYLDWRDLFFLRKVRAYKGARASEIERANIIVNTGADEYLESSRAQYEAGNMTAKQFRTIREFIRDYEEDGKKFKTIISKQEIEYKWLIYKVYDVTRK